jgi:cytochrome P450/NADPH-cytochrome P450 reductase
LDGAKINGKRTLAYCLLKRIFDSRNLQAIDVGRCDAMQRHGRRRARSHRFRRRRLQGRLLSLSRDAATIRQTKAGFHLPADPATPLVMIGPGTGLAPFRGFLQQRAALKAKGETIGPAMLFFGCRHPEQDFLYADELKAFADQGIVELHVAFSRAGETKTYVQHLIAAQKDRVGALIDVGAIVFVCGDGSRMEPDVKRALMALHQERAGGDEAEARRWIGDLGAKNRYVLDVWGGI